MFLCCEEKQIVWKFMDNVLHGSLKGNSQDWKRKHQAVNNILANQAVNNIFSYKPITLFLAQGF